MSKLTAVKVRALNAPGRYADGGGLYLQVRSPTAKSWLFRFTLNGRTHAMGIGSVQTITLAQARDKAIDYRRRVADGINPIHAKKEEGARRVVTFKEAAEEYLNAHMAILKNEKQRIQWRNSLTQYVFPTIGALPVDQIKLEHVLSALKPIWTQKAETANRVRMRIEKILDAAKIQGWRSDDNPAAWKGNLAHVLSRRPKATHLAALPWKEISAFMAGLRAQNGIAARALEFAILTGVRSGEARGAMWTEINLDGSEWRIPPERMKAGREHRVQLSIAAKAILLSLPETKDEGLVFPGARSGRQLSDMAMTQVLRRMGYASITVHGFRSSFRDWAAEETEHSSEVAEMALAHTVGNRTEAAYRRGDLRNKRVLLMDDWAEWCLKAPEDSNKGAVG